MSGFRGGGRGRGRGRGGFRGGRGRGRGGYGGYQEGPPEFVAEVGDVQHECEGQLVCKMTMGDRVPYFNAPIYLKNKSEIGKIDEVFGPFEQVYFSIKPAEGVQASSFKADDKVYISGQKLLHKSMFDPTKPQKTISKGGRGGGRGRGGRGGFRGGRGGGRGGFRGGRGGGRGGFRGRGGGRGRGRGFSRGGGRGRGRY